MRCLIVEEALESGKGHWPSYIGDLAGGFRAAGDEVDVLVHRQATDEVVGRVGGTRWLSRNCWVDPRSQGKAGGLLHNWHFFRELRSWLKGREPYDRVLALTMRLQHLLAFSFLAGAGWLPERTRFLLLFVQGFGTYQGPGVPTGFPGGMSMRLAGFAFAKLAPAVRDGRVELAAETKGMQDELRRFTGLPVSLFPHPVPTAPESSEKPASPVVIACPGFARHEKGNDLLQEAIKTLLAGPDGGRLKFIVQWPDAFAMPDGSMLGPDPGLIQDPRVEFLNRSLDAAEYEALLQRTHLIVLPYRRESYHHRVSRVAIEAATRGIPLVYMDGTWSQEIAALAGCGVAIADETGAAVAEGLDQAIRRLGALADLARAGAPAVSAYCSVSRFRSQLADEIAG